MRIEHERLSIVARLWQVFEMHSQCVFFSLSFFFLHAYFIPQGQKEHYKTQRHCDAYKISESCQHVFLRFIVLSKRISPRNLSLKLME